MRHRGSNCVGVAALAGLVATAVLTCGAVATAPRSPVDKVLVNASENMCRVNATCPQDPAPPGPDLGDQATAEQRIIDGYLTKQRGCSPDLAPNPQGVTWDSRASRQTSGARERLTMPIHDWAANSAPTGWMADGKLCIRIADYRRVTSRLAEGPARGRSRHTPGLSRDPGPPARVRRTVARTCW